MGRSKMLSLALLTVLASTALLTEAAPSAHGYFYRPSYYHHRYPYYYHHYRPSAVVYHHAHHGHKMAVAPVMPMADPASKMAVGDVVDVAVGAGSFTTLVQIVSDLGLVDTLKGVDAVTIFAPSDDAFAKLPAGTLESLTPEQAKAIVSRHVVAGASVYASDVATGTVGTFGGETVGLVKTDEGGVQVTYNGQTVNVVTADVKASNGVIHVIDNVILGAPEPAPEPAVGDVVDVAVGAGAFTTLVKIVSDLGLVDTLKGVEAVTIFAPSDDAFAKLPAGTLES